MHIFKQSFDHIMLYNQQGVSNITHVCEQQSFHTVSMTNSKWVRLHIFESQSNHIISYDKQGVGDMCIFVNSSLTTDIAQLSGKQSNDQQPGVNDISLHFCERQSPHISSYDWQGVGDFAHFLNRNLITSFPTNCSLWVTLHIFVKRSLIISFPVTNSLWVILHIWQRESHEIFCHDQW